VISLVAGQPEQPLFENRIAAVPERQRETQPLVVVGDSRDSILAPAICPQVRLLERKEFPRGSVFAIILANRPQGARIDTGPAPPVLFPPPSFVQAPFLGFMNS